MRTLNNLFQKKELDMEMRLILRAWKDEKFKKELIANPKEVIRRELNINIPDDVEIHVVEETPNKLYFVLPASATQDETSDDELDGEDLKNVAGGGGGNNQIIDD